MKKTLHRGGFETLNVYTNLAGGFLGYAYLPGLPDSHLWQDGIVINWESMPDASPTFEGRYDLGQTLAHEAGHWLNLEHTFYGGCNAKGDFVDDTPPMREPTRGCPEGKDTCGEPGLDPIHNYMDYSVDRLLRPVHRGPGRAHAGRLTSSSSRARSKGSLARAGASPAVPATLAAPRARSSGDRAFASGAKGRTFESCRAHAFRRMLRRLRKQLPKRADPEEAASRPGRLRGALQSAENVVGSPRGGSLRLAPLPARPQRVLRRRRADGALGADPRHARARRRCSTSGRRMTYGRTAGILVGVGMMGAIIFGVWLAIHVEAYQVWDGWILASLVLWAIGGWAGGQAGRAFESGGRPRRRDPLPDDQQRRRADHPRAHDLEAGSLSADRRDPARLGQLAAVPARARRDAARGDA